MNTDFYVATAYDDYRRKYRHHRHYWLNNDDTDPGVENIKLYIPTEIVGQCAYIEYDVDNNNIDILR